MTWSRINRYAEPFDEFDEDADEREYLCDAMMAMV
jgi:hypothetical protein